MAQIINNGDVITIRANFPIVGLIEVLGWNDTTTGETGSVYFEKKIRWTYDGINVTINFVNPMFRPLATSICAVFLVGTF